MATPGKITICVPHDGLTPQARARLEKLVEGYGDGYRIEAYLHALYALANLQPPCPGVLAYMAASLTKKPPFGDVAPREAVVAYLEAALRLFGYLAETVLAHWNVTEPRDVGTLFWRLAEADLVKRGPHERLEEYFYPLDFRAYLETRFLEGLRRVET